MMLHVRPLTDDQQRSNTADRRKYMAIIMAITHLLIKEANQQLNITAAKSKLRGLPSFGGQMSPYKAYLRECIYTPEQGQ